MSSAVTSQPTLHLLVNGVAQCSIARTLAQWVASQGLSPEAVATAVNGQFVPRGLRAQHMLADGDQLLTFQPIEGG